MSNKMIPPSIVKIEDDVDEIMRQTNEKISSLNTLKDMDNIIKNVIPKISGDSPIRKQLELFINKK